MSFVDIILSIIRWTHAVAAAVWVGGNLWYFLVLNPTLKKAPEQERPKLSSALSGAFRELTEVCIIVLAISGGVLTFDRLTNSKVGAAYITVLVVKILLALWMFYVAYALSKREVRPTRWARIFTSPATLLALGFVALALASALKVLFEATLT